MNSLDVGRSLLASLLAAQIRSKRRAIVAIAAGVIIVALFLVWVLDGWWQWVFVAAALLSAAVLLTVWFTAMLTIWLLRRYIGPDDTDLEQFDDKHESIEQAIEELDIPTGPVSVARLAWRLRGGVGEEFDRVSEIAIGLKTQLGL